jgi:glycosyltransferase involved in cell wall biosynthesis
VYDCHELTPGVYQEWYGPFVSRIASQLETTAIQWVDAIIAANEAISRYLRTSNVPAEVIYSCPALADMPRINQRDARKRLGLCGFITLFSGRVRQDYDFDMLLDAARDLKRNTLWDFRFVFIGPAETMAPLVNKAIDEDLQSLFDFRGWVHDEDLLLYYVASDLCFAVTRDLGLNTKILTPIKLFESMACGVPVVVREGTLAAEITRQCGCGIVVENARTPLSAELMRLKNNRQLLRGLSNAGRKAFLAEYNWDRMQDRLLHLYARLKLTGARN